MNIQSQFNSIINYAKEKGYLRANPLADIKNMGIKDKRVEFWTPEEYEKFAYHAMEYPMYYYSYEILYWCGLRQGEMLALTLEDIDLKQGIISVTKTLANVNGKEIISTPKTPSSVRKVSMPRFLVDEIEEYIGLLPEPEREGRIFKSSKSTLNKNFKSITEEAGLKRITVHGLRHSHVSLLISKKYDIFEVSKRIGHKSVKTTQDIYGHLFDDVQKSIANDLDKLRRGA
ncbi:MAG: site-specific integrase [Anaerobutyricum hallii]|uniref:site-specific integrase n=1 Tax=Anaerobutyricum hallii TaxID=39488 RepID=UPI002A83DC69|nr:site-specific integrase [Anaerobutyricum hallii]MDY4579076.1 site-specific integrase [Anaerobutyricum hallii]